MSSLLWLPVDESVCSQSLSSVPILKNILTDETARPLYKSQRNVALNLVFNTPGLLEFLAENWLQCREPDTVEVVCNFLLEASLAFVEARSSPEVKTIARLMTETSVHLPEAKRLCAVVLKDVPQDLKVHSSNERRDATPIIPWGADLIPPGGRHDNDHLNYRDVSIVPTQEELAYQGRSWLPLSNGSNDIHTDREEALLDKNFRLLREDFSSSMRENIAGPRPHKVWKNARIIGASCMDERRFAPLYFIIQFDAPKRNIDWDRQRLLPINSLVSLHDGQRGDIMATVSIRRCDRKNEWLLSPGGPTVGLVLHHENDVTLALRHVSSNKGANELYEGLVAKLSNTVGSAGREELLAELELAKAGFTTMDLMEVSDSFFAYKPILESLQVRIKTCGPVPKISTGLI